MRLSRPSLGLPCSGSRTVDASRDVMTLIASLPARCRVRTLLTSRGARVAHAHTRSIDRTMVLVARRDKLTVATAKYSRVRGVECPGGGRGQGNMSRGEGNGRSGQKPRKMGKLTEPIVASNYKGSAPQMFFY